MKKDDYNYLINPNTINNITIVEDTDSKKLEQSNVTIPDADTANKNDW